MNRDDVRKLLPEFVLGTLEDTVSRQIEDFAKKDPAIQNEIDQLDHIRLTAASLRAGRPAFSSEWVDDVMNAVHAEPAQAAVPASRISSGFWIIIVAAIVAIFFFIDRADSEIVKIVVSGLPAIFISLSFGLFSIFAVANRNYRVGVACMSVCFVMLMARESTTPYGGYVILEQSPTPGAVPVSNGAFGGSKDSAAEQQSSTETAPRKQQNVAEPVFQDARQDKSAKPQAPLGAGRAKKLEEFQEEKSASKVTIPAPEKGVAPASAPVDKKEKRTQENDRKNAQQKESEGSTQIKDLEDFDASTEISPESNPNAATAGSASRATSEAGATGGASAADSEATQQYEKRDELQDSFSRKRDAPAPRGGGASFSCNSLISRILWNVPVVDRSGLRVGQLSDRTPSAAIGVTGIVTIELSVATRSQTVTIEWDKAFRSIRVYGAVADSNGKITLPLDSKTRKHNFIFEGRLTSYDWAQTLGKVRFINSATGEESVEEIRFVYGGEALEVSFAAAVIAYCNGLQSPSTMESAVTRAIPLARRVPDWQRDPTRAAWIGYLESIALSEGVDSATP